MALLPLELRCFGPPSARLTGISTTPAELRWRKHVGLLIYLALSPDHSRSRDHLVGLLWGEEPERGARKSLNMAVRRLRVALGADRLRSETDTLVLSDEALDVDALRFQARAPDAPDEALPLLRGEFLEGFHIKDAPGFEDWMMRERERYRGLATATLLATGERHLAAGLSDAADLARRALALEPHSEAAVALLMRSAALVGNAAMALTAYHEFAEKLKRELGEQPGRALIALAARVRSQSWQPRAREVIRETPLVGRESLHRVAFETIARGLSRNGGPQALVITGAPGMGRSRLVAECLRRLALDGALVLQARPVESDHDAPWSALRLLARSGLVEAPGFPAARRESLSAFATIVPALAERIPPRELRDVADVASALADVLAAVTEERSVAIALDDAHWSDGASIAALGAAVASIKSAPLVLIVTVALGVGDPPRELVSLQSDIGRAIPGVALRLGALDEADIAKLVSTVATWCRDDADRDRLTRRVMFETAGNPFFAATLLSALARKSTLRSDLIIWPPAKGTFDTPLPFSIPNVVRHAMAFRVAELQAEERAVLCAASVCGQALDPGLLVAVTGMTAAAVEQTLPALERHQLIQFDGRRYTFVAPLVAQVVRAECMTRGARHALEQNAADALRPRTDLESRALRAELLADVRSDEAAFTLALEVGMEAVRGGARRLAQRAVAIADSVSRRAQLDRQGLDELRAQMASVAMQ